MIVQAKTYQMIKKQLKRKIKNRYKFCANNKKMMFFTHKRVNYLFKY